MSVGKILTRFDYARKSLLFQVLLKFKIYFAADGAPLQQIKSAATVLTPLPLLRTIIFFFILNLLNVLIL